MRMIAVFEKKEGAKFTSHLDMQRAMQRALRRADVPVQYSAGFNPHMLMSFATALSLGFTSKGELVDICMQDMDAGDFFDKVSAVMPPALRLVKAYEVEDHAPSLTSLLERAQYEITMPLGAIADADELSKRLQSLLAEPILCMKKGKAGVKEVDIRTMITDCSLLFAQETTLCIALTCACTATGALNPQLLLPHLVTAFEISEAKGEAAICRVALLGKDGIAL